MLTRQPEALAEADATVAARQEVLGRARKDAEAQRDALLDKAHAEAARIVAEGRATDKRNASDSRAQTLARARDLAAVIAERALTAQPQDFNGYLSQLVAALQKMPPAELSAYSTGGPGTDQRRTSL